VKGGSGRGSGSGGQITKRVDKKQAAGSFQWLCGWFAGDRRRVMMSASSWDWTWWKGRRSKRKGDGWGVKVGAGGSWRKLESDGRGRLSTLCPNGTDTDRGLRGVRYFLACFKGFASKASYSEHGSCLYIT
jgi:hypothetical protein